MRHAQSHIQEGIRSTCGMGHAHHGHGHHGDSGVHGDGYHGDGGGSYHGDHCGWHGIAHH